MPISPWNQEFPAEQVQIETRGVAGIMTLSRPEAMNALSLEMIRTLAATLKRWENDDSIKLVIFKGAGGKAFCAGGDLKAFYNAAMDFRRGDVEARVPALYFAEEYSLNKQIFHYKKPTLAFMNGITMGGGFGLAGHCRMRVATDSTVFAMPETRIGFFPDVGSLYQLLKCPGHVGWYLALTGSSIGPTDMIYAGLADYFVPGAQSALMMERLCSSDNAMDVLADLNQKPPTAEILHHNSAIIEKIFGLESIDDIVQALVQDGSEWAQAVHATLRSRSPASVAVTAAHLESAQGCSFDKIIEADFMLAQKFIARPDMCEGIRALILDKDNVPLWQPAQIEDLTPDDIKDYFTPTDYHLKDVQIFKT